MKIKVVKLFFLIIAGFAILWSEWTRSVLSDGSVVLQKEAVQQVGSLEEASTVVLIFILGIIVVAVVNGYEYNSSKLSSPNSV